MNNLHLPSHLLQLYTYIYQHPYTSIDNLAYHFDKSKRTIYTYIKEINEYFPVHCNQITLHHNPNGYYIQSYPTHLSNYAYDDQYTRIHQLMIELLMHNEYKKIDDFASHYYVSAQTIKNDLKIVKKRLNNYNIEIIHKPYHGIIIQGDEKYIRKALTDIVCDHKIVEFTDEECRFFSEFDIYTLSYFILSTLNGNNISIPDYQLKLLIFQIGISIMRIQHNHIITEYSEIKIIPSPVFNQIIHRCELNFHIDIPQSEKIYLYKYFVSTIEYITISDLGKDIQIQKIAHDFIKKLDNKYHFNLLNDEIFFNDIIYHLQAFIKRIELGMDNPNPLLEEIKKKYTFEYDITLEAMRDIIQKYGVSEDEIGFFTLHVRSSLERNRYLISQKVLHITLVCTTGLGTKRLMETKLINAFENQIIIDQSISFYEYQNLKDIKSDVIISTVNIPKKGKPIILINPLFNKYDEMALRKKINKLINDQSVFNNLFNPNLFQIITKKIKNKNIFLQDICHTLEKLNYVDEKFFKDVCHREKMSSTAIGHCIAIPHAINSNIKKSFIHISILKKPLIWDENKKVQLVFVLGIKDDDLVHMRQFNHILSNYLDNVESINELLKSNSYTEFEECFKKVLKK